MLSPQGLSPPPHNHLLGQYNAPNKRANVRKCIARTRVIRYTTLHGVCPMPIYVHRIEDKIIDKDASPAPSIHRRRDDQKNPKTTFNTQQQSHSMSIHLLSHLSLTTHFSALRVTILLLPSRNVLLCPRRSTPRITVLNGMACGWSIGKQNKAPLFDYTYQFTWCVVVHVHAHVSI